MADPSSLDLKIILFGSRGMVGSSLAALFSSPNLVAYNHQELDITDFASAERSFVKVKPHVVLNAAAFTRVDDCERLRETAFLVNAQAPAHLAALCKKNNAFLVHFSTDYVFDGNSDKPYSETHPFNPLNYYGTTKLEGEKRVISSGCSFLILRTSWIFGKSGDNFVKKILRRASAGARLEAPIDQIGCPTYSEDIAGAIHRLLSIRAEGIYHFTNAGHCSRFEQAQTILQLYGLNNPIEAVKNDDLHLPAKRPRYSVLDMTEYREATGHAARSWQQSTADYISYLKRNQNELRS